MTDPFPPDRGPGRFPDINIVLDPFGPPPPVVPPRKRPGKDPGDARPPDQAGLPQPVPIPVPAPRAPTPAPFPTGPAANDPVFSIGKVLLGRGIAAVNIAIILRDIFEMAARNAEIEDERRRKAQDQIEARRRGATKPLREIVFPADFPEPPRPDAAPAPAKIPRPRPEIFPAPLPAPRPAPRPVSVPVEIPLPGPAGIPTPGPIAVPRSPSPSTRPGPGTRGRPSVPPLPGPVFFPIFLPFGAPSVRPFPVGDIFPKPSPTPGDLTRFNPRGVPSPLGFADPVQFPQPQPEADPQRCQEVKRRRRRKGKCREGFFIEEQGKTKYVTWRTKDCATGRTISEKGRRAKNVIPLPGV